MTDIHLITLKDAARMLASEGADVSYNMVWTRCRVGDLEAVRVDCHYMFTEAQYLAALEYFKGRKRMIRRQK